MIIGQVTFGPFKESGSGQINIPLSLSTPPKAPHCCPVCEGRGDLPVNFYTRATLASDLTPVQCRTCNGLGIVWS